MASGQEEINNLLREANKLKKEALKLIEESGAKTKSEISDFKKNNQDYKERIQLLKDINERVRDIKEANIRIIDDYIRQEKSVRNLSGLQSSLASIESNRLNKMISMKNLDDDKRKTFDSIAALQHELASLSAEDVIAKQHINNQLDDYYRQLNGVAGVHAHIKKNLLEQRNIADGISSLTLKQQQFLEKQRAVLDGIKDSIGGILQTAEVLTSTTGGMIGSSLIGAGFLVDKFAQIRKELGGIAPLSTTIISFFDENAVSNAKALASQFGGINNVSMELQISTSLISKNLGISGDEAANLLGAFSRVNGNSTDIAKDLITSSKEFAKQNGLIPSKLMSDLANNTEAFALYAKQGGKNIIEAAGYAQKLGVEFSTLTGIADNLLDFETSITKELELGAMLGRNINLDRARALAFEGEIGDAVQETLKAMGGIEEFNKLDPIAKKATADLLGVSVTEMGKMIANQEKANDMTSIMNEKFSMLNEMMEYGVNEWGGGLLKTFGSGLIAIGQMGAGLKELNKLKMVQFLKEKAILGIQKIQSLFSQKELVTQQAKTTQLAVQEGISKSKKGMSSVTSTIPPISDTANPAKKGGIMDSLSKIKMNDVLKGAAALVIVAGAVFIFGKAVQEFMQVSWEAVGMAVVSMLSLVGAVTLLGLLMSSGIGAVAILAGAAAMLVIAASVLVLGNALQSIGTGFEMLGSGISTLVPTLVGIGETIASLVMFIPAITALSLSLMGLSASLVAVGAAGILAAPGLMALSAVGTIATGLGSLLGIGGDEGGGSDDSMKLLLDEIKGLRNDLNSGKIGVYMDGTAVASKISKVVDRIGVNSYS